MWAFEGNILALMFKKVYEDPVDTVEDVIARGLIPVLDPPARFYVDHLAQSDNKLYRDLASITVVAEDWPELWDLIEYGVQGAATHVYLCSFLSEAWWDYVDGQWIYYPDLKDFGEYHFSQEVLSGFHPYSGYIVNKYFHLKEQLAKHILLHQQVC